MIAIYVPIAACWRVMFGANFTGVRGVMHWNTRKALVSDLNRCGLKLGRNNVITTDASVQA